MRDEFVDTAFLVWPRYERVRGIRDQQMRGRVCDLGSVRGQQGDAEIMLSACICWNAQAQLADLARRQAPFRLAKRASRRKAHSVRQAADDERAPRRQRLGAVQRQSERDFLPGGSVEADWRSQ